MSNTGTKNTVTLKELRLAKGLSQTLLGAKMGLKQRRVSMIELNNLHTQRLGSISKYVEALGGQLKILVELDGKAFEINLEPAPEPTADKE